MEINWLIASCVRLITKWVEEIRKLFHIREECKSCQVANLTLDSGIPESLQSWMNIVLVSRCLRRGWAWARDWQLVPWEMWHCALSRAGAASEKRRREAGRGHEDTQPHSSLSLSKLGANLPKRPSLYCKHYTGAWCEHCHFSLSLKTPSEPSLGLYSDLHQTSSSIPNHVDKRTSQLMNPIWCSVIGRFHSIWLFVLRLQSWPIFLTLLTFSFVLYPTSIGRTYLKHTGVKLRTECTTNTIRLWIIYI